MSFVHLSCGHSRNCIDTGSMKSQAFALYYANAYKTWSDLCFSQSC